MDDARTSPTPPHIPTDKPSVARMYDYYLGGHHNFAIDRAAAEAVLAIAPDIGLGARANRAFLRRVVRFLVARGVAQFLDVGAGIPTVGNTHEMAGAADPAARVAYVDIDPVAVAHARAILGDHPHATAIAADGRQPATILAHPAVRGLLDFDRPVAVLLLAFLHLLPDDDEARRVVAAFVAALPPGGYLAIAHATVEGAPSEQIAQIERLYAGTTTPAKFRPRSSIAAFFAGTELVAPGLVPAPPLAPRGRRRRPPRRAGALAQPRRAGPQALTREAGDAGEEAQMDASAHASLYATLTARRLAIADRWYRAIAETGFAPLGGPTVRARLLALTDRAIAALLAEPFAPDEARQIGAALAELHYLHPAALAGTLAVLGEELVADVPPAAAATLQPSLAALLGALAGGYYAAARAAILAEQEAARAPLLAEQRRIEAVLRASEARLRAVVTNSPVLLFALDRDGVFTLAEGQGLAALGLTRESIVGRAVEERFAAVPTLAREVRRALAGEDCTAIVALGELVIEARHTPVWDGSGMVAGVIGVAFDITARVRAEERLRTVVDHAPLILFATDRAGVITLSEGRGLAALGRQPGELVGQSAWVNAVLVPDLPEALRRALAGEAFTATTTVRGATFEIHYVPLHDPHGTPAGMSGVAIDITPRVTAEQAARLLAIRLSPQETRVLPLLARADLRTYREIGAAAYMAGETARGHAQAIARKLGLATSERAAIVVAARELGLLEESPAPPSEG